MSLQFVLLSLHIQNTLYTALNKLNKHTMTTNKQNQDRTGQLITRNIFYQTVVAVTQFIQKLTSVASQNNTRQFKINNPQML